MKVTNDFPVSSVHLQLRELHFAVRHFSQQCNIHDKTNSRMQMTFCGIKNNSVNSLGLIILLRKVENTVVNIKHLLAGVPCLTRLFLLSVRVKWPLDNWWSAVCPAPLIYPWPVPWGN